MHPSHLPHLLRRDKDVLLKSASGHGHIVATGSLATLPRAYTLGVAHVRKRGQSALDTALIRKMHRHLMSGDSRAAPGQFRSVQNFIGGLKMEHARFIPPPPSEVPRLMTDLDRLIRYQTDPESHYDIGVLSRAPIVHAQFEAIHPFVDGNGRIGRLLLPLMFVGDGGFMSPHSAFAARASNHRRTMARTSNGTPHSKARDGLARRPSLAWSACCYSKLFGRTLGGHLPVRKRSRLAKDDIICASR